MNEKFIIENRTNLSMNQCLLWVLEVVKLGKISNNNTEYCTLTAFDNSNYVVIHHQNKRSSKFIVIKYRN